MFLSLRANFAAICEVSTYVSNPTDYIHPRDIREIASNHKVNPMNSRRFLVWLILCLGLWIGVSGCSLIPKPFFNNVKRISKESLKARLEDPTIVILDVRQPQDWNKSGIKIKGAIQENPNKFNDWYYRYPKTKTIVLY